jgi:hypothetical protein
LWNLQNIIADSPYFKNWTILNLFKGKFRGNVGKCPFLLHIWAKIGVIVGCALMSQIFRAQAWEERSQSPESGNIFLFEIGQYLTGDLVEWTVNSLKMNHAISQEWQEIGLRNFVHMLFDARAFKCDTLWVPECFQRLGISRSFFTIFHQKWTCYCKVLEALTNSKSITFESPGIKEHMYKISKPYLLPFLRN